MKRFFLAVLSIPAVSFSYAQTADEIIDKHITAVGGLDSWKKVNSMVSTGTLQIQSAEIALSQTILNNKGSRLDISAMGMNEAGLTKPSLG